MVRIVFVPNNPEGSSIRFVDTTEMLHPDTPFSWSETPRMRWRAYGIVPYIGELAVGSGILGGLAFVALLLARRSWMEVTLAAGVGALAGMLLQMLPKPVALRNGSFSYGTSNSYDFQYWPIKRCRVLRIVPVRGVVRIEVEVPVRYDPMHDDKPYQKTTFVVVARPKHFESIRRAFEAGGATFADESAGTRMDVDACADKADGVL